MQGLAEQVRRWGNPLIEPGRATFVWLGESAPSLAGDWTDWDPQRHEALAPVEPGVWAWSLALADDAYIEYAWFRGAERVCDPLNRTRTPNGTGQFNHWFRMPGSRPDPFYRQRRPRPVGRLETTDLPAGDTLGSRTRRVHFYWPAGVPETDALPLLLAFDGREYRDRVWLPQRVDALVTAGRMAPAALALLENAGQRRMLEYGCADLLLVFLLDRLLPAARARLNLVDPGRQPGAFGVLGASMGGLMALYTSLRLPELFGRVLSQSGAFGFTGFDFPVYPLAEWLDPAGQRVWMDWGRYEGLRETNQRMARLLQQRGYTLRAREYAGGHNYPAWREDLADGLSWMYAANS